MIMIKATIEKNDWYDYKESSWGGAISTLNEVEKQGREHEAVGLIEYYFSEDRLGYIPSETEVNNFIWFSLPGIMHLYDNEEYSDDDDEDDDKEYEDDEEE